VSPPALSIARRAARILSTATPSSWSGRAASPVESSIDSPATPVSTARRTLSRHAGGIGGETTLEVGVHGQIGRGDHVGEMRECHLARDAVVRPRARPREARARRRERLEAQALQIARAARVPRIGDDEAPGRVQLTERAPAISDGRTCGMHAIRSSMSRKLA
jgi:hypothetical protein